ncbi:MAG TPA: ParA family protein [Arcobacter sp.]|nr:ParA family protein [Arcobacter sp.]
MPKFISLYNNKGGVGKTTLSLFFSDFLASITINKKRSKVLVIDFDPQGSSSNAILGIAAVSDIKNSNLTLPHAICEKNKGKDIEINDYVFSRDEKEDFKTRKTKLGKLDVIISSPEFINEFEENSTLNKSLKLSNWLKEQLSDDYDFIFIDLPGNISKRNGFSLIGAFLTDYFIIPTELNRININAIPLTLQILDNIKEWGGERNKYELLGFVLNKADKRSKQYKLHIDELSQFANMKECKVFKCVLPPTPKLSNATDDSIENFTLSDKYDSYYPNVRSLVLEVIKDLGYSLKKKSVAS